MPGRNPSGLRRSVRPVKTTLNLKISDGGVKSNYLEPEDMVLKLAVLREWIKIQERLIEIKKDK